MHKQRGEYWTTYNAGMARGWESKSVENQQEEARRELGDKKTRLTPNQASAEREKQGLLLARRRILQQIAAARNPRHRQMLEKALADTDGKLLKFR